MAITPGTPIASLPAGTADAETNAAEIRTAIGAAAETHDHPATGINDSTAAGRALLKAADAAAQVALLSAVTTSALAAGSKHVRQGTNQTVNNNSTPAATSLVLPLEVGTWEITGFAVTSSATNAPGVRFRFSFSGVLNADGYDRAVAIQSTQGGATGTVISNNIGSNLDSVSTSSAHNTVFSFVVRVTTAGNLVVEVALKSSTAENTVLSLLSNMTAKKIGA